MQLRLLNFATLTQHMAAAVQASAARRIDLSVGSVLRAVLEANAGIGLWLQWLILRVLQNSRAATSSGADLDSWMADFGLGRLPAMPAGGIVTFSRLTPGLAAFIPVDSLVRTADGTQGYTVVADTTHPEFIPTQNGYAMAVDMLALDVPVRAIQVGAAANVLPGTITQPASALAGIDAVSNAAPTSGGADAESDAALRARFTDFMDTRSRATYRAVAHAIGGVQQGLSHAIAENTDSAGQPRIGHFTVTVDDGSGAPSSALLAMVTARIEAVRPLGSVFSVQPPVVVTADVAVTLSLAPEVACAAVRAAVGAAIATYMNGLGIAMPLPLSRIAQLAHDASGAVRTVGTVLLNNMAADITPPAHGVIKAGVVSVS